jgi:hypothetical protein
LSAHNIRERFYLYENAGIEIKADAGYHLDILKEHSENIVVILYKTEKYGQLVFSVVFSHKKGLLENIEHMTMGLTDDIEFTEQRGRYLNPEVLIELLTSQPFLKRGKIHRLDLSNKKRFELVEKQKSPSLDL